MSGRVTTAARPRSFATPVSYTEFLQRRHDEQERRERLGIPGLTFGESGEEQQRNYVPDWAKPRLKFPNGRPKSKEC